MPPAVNRRVMALLGHNGVNIDTPEARESTYFDSSGQLAPEMCPPKVDD